MSRRLMLISTACLVLMIVLGGPLVANGQITQSIAVAVKEDPAGGFSNADLNGRYWWRRLGLHNFEASNREAEIVYGYFDADGAGSSTGYCTGLTSDGITESKSANGTYSVNTDGSFISDIDTGYISSDGNFVISSTGGTDQSGVHQGINLFVKEPDIPLTLAGINGTWQFRNLEVHRFEEFDRDAVNCAGIFDFNNGNWSATFDCFESNGETENGTASGNYSINGNAFDFLETSTSDIFSAYPSKDGNTLIVTKADTSGGISQWIGIAVKKTTKTFTNADLSGTYNIHVMYLYDFESDNREVVIFTGPINFDGFGNWTNNTGQNFNSKGEADFTGSGFGTYSVNSDGSFTFIQTSDHPSDAFYGNISSDNNIITINHVQKTVVTSPPDKPILLSPANGASGVSLTPTLQTGSFSDPDNGDTHLQTEWQISTMSDFSSNLIHLTSTVHLTSLTVPDLTLDDETTYYWRVRFYDNNSISSPWSDPYSFTTLTITGTRPDKPTLSSPSNGSTGVSLTPILRTGSFSDSDIGGAHLQTEWQISIVSDFSSDVLREISTVHLTSLTIPRLTLDEGTTYYWRVRFYDNNSNASPWSDTYSFTTRTTTNDQNENGIPDEQENDTVDLDNDGTPDTQQDDIKTLNTLIGDGQMGVSRKDSPNVTSIESIESINPEFIFGLARPYSMPLGLFALRLNVANAGDTAQVTVYFSEAAPVYAKWYMYDSINAWQDYSDHATFSMDRMSVLLELQDGGFGDVDGAANGVIVDPGGFGLASWIEGYVSDTSTANGIAFAEIGIRDLVIKTMSDGYYLSMILPGTYSSIVSAEGYQALSKQLVINEGDIEDYNIALTSCGFGSEKIYFPHIASDGIWETEICVINTGSQERLCGELRAYNNSGQQVDSKAISLFPNARREIIVGNEFSNPANIGYIVLGSDSQTTNGYLKFYEEGRYRVAIPAATEVNAGDIYISHIASDDNWTTGISILNTTSASKDLSVEFDNGTTKTQSIAANEHKAFTISGLFDGQSQSGINSAVIKNGSGIIGLEIFGSTASSGANYLSGILLKDDTATNIYFPHVASDSIWGTGIVAYNPSGTSCNLTITPYSEVGTPLSTQTQSLDGHEKYIGSPETLKLPSGTAWFSILADSPITGFELFSTKDGNQLGGYTGVGISGTDGVFAKIDKDGTGIVFVNIEDSSATVTMTAYCNCGDVIATETVNLAAHQKKVDVPSRLFAEDISSATYIAYSSSGNVVGFQLNVSSDGMMLDALPGM